MEAPTVSKCAWGKMLMFLAILIFFIFLSFVNFWSKQCNGPQHLRLKKPKIAPAKTQLDASHHNRSLYVKNIPNVTVTLHNRSLYVKNIPIVTVRANCLKLFSNDTQEIIKAEKYQESNKKKPIAEEEYMHLAADCKLFIKKRQYITEPLSKEEESFPIAYSILVFKDLEQVERLLRSIYHPQNYYCIHVDKKSAVNFKNSIRTIAKCFPNVFIASKLVDVQWATYSVLEPELVCMQDLWKYKKWRYFINLTGQEFPLKTNLDLVKILKVYNGANNMEGTKTRRNIQNLKWVYEMPERQRTETKKGPAPYGLQPIKGSAHIVASRAFVDYVLHNKVALALREWVKDTIVPDETFFSTLNHNPKLKIPGAYLGYPESDPYSYPFMTRFKNWDQEPFIYPCAGKRVRWICIFSVGDLPLLKSRPEMFANKFHLDYHPLALDCMEQLHFNRMRDEVLGIRKLNTSYYKTLSFVLYHV